MRYRVVIKPKAEKELARVSKQNRGRMVKALQGLASNPFAGKKLTGNYHGYYSIRVWPYRIIYHIYKKEFLVIVIRIGHRQGVY
ncbi:MAG: type II toxin-antitoxin system RelE/ParE family toxin [Candidatus Jacksonbacteria bacterium]|nr:type II toxin-antitoxin system RelE/ParE family toxin [Candidatus Jacksonbacteria bacterium]